MVWIFGSALKICRVLPRVEKSIGSKGRSNEAPDVE